MTWKNDIYPDQRPGSGYCNDLDERAIRNEKRAAEAVRLARLLEETAWETKAECWEIPEEEEEESNCANCGRVGHHSEFTEAVRRCGTGYGEWYCNDGTGCQAVVCFECNGTFGKAAMIWDLQEDTNERKPRCRNGFGCRRKNAR